MSAFRRPFVPAVLLAAGLGLARAAAGDDAAPADEIETLRRQLAAQQATLDGQRAMIAAQQQALVEQEARLVAMAGQLDRLTALLEPAGGSGAAEAVAAAPVAPTAPELPADIVTAGELPGSIRIPGTDRTVRLGGLVRFSMIRTLAPLGSDDRFLTYSIPVGEESAGDAERFRTNVRPSRLNFEVREPVRDETLRAFLEADFASATGNSFRLRHAYLQWRDVLVGQTWSTFSDPESEPEDLDFEGLNSLNILRQPQVRWTPSFGSARLAIALEDSQASITGAESVNRFANVVVGRRRRTDSGHLFTAVSIRDLRGQVAGSPGQLDSAIGWGVTVAGRQATPWAGGADALSFQLTTGEGVATYVADLAAAGGQDAVFDPVAGRIHPLRASALSLGYLHAWPELPRLRALRSSLVAGLVDVDNQAIQPEDAYHRTLRLSANVVTSPVAGVDLGLQYIWGRRENKDGARGSSSQIQWMAQYRF